jgi:hypothetical protein
MTDRSCISNSQSCLKIENKHKYKHVVRTLGKTKNKQSLTNFLRSHYSHLVGVQESFKPSIIWHGISNNYSCQILW